MNYLRRKKYAALFYFENNYKKIKQAAIVIMKRHIKDIA